MTPVKFPEVNCVYAEDQDEYESLPVHKTNDGQVITCFQLTREEITELINTKKLWISMLTFNKPLQPIFLSTQNVWFEEEGPKDNPDQFEFDFS